MDQSKPRQFWIRVGVHSLPCVFDKEPMHITQPMKHGWNNHHKGQVVHVIEMKAIESYKQEIAALRSVLSEWETDKTCYVQFNEANRIARERDSHGADETQEPET